MIQFIINSDQQDVNDLYPPSLANPRFHHHRNYDLLWTLTAIYY